MIHNVKTAINEVLVLSFNDKQKAVQWWKTPSEYFSGKTPDFMWKFGSRGKYKVSTHVLKILDISDTIHALQPIT